MKRVAYPSGLRGLIANQLFVGSNPTATSQFTLDGLHCDAMCIIAPPFPPNLFAYRNII